MSKTSSVGGESGRFPTHPAKTPSNTINSTPQQGHSGSTNRKTQVVSILSEPSLRARIKHFLPVPLYKFLASLMAPRKSEQHLLAKAIHHARDANSKAWDQLGREKNQCKTPQQLNRLQLACEKTQYQLDLLEGRQDSQTTAQRLEVIHCLEAATASSDDNVLQLESEYLAANEQLKKIQQHELELEAELNAAEHKLQAAQTGHGSSEINNLETLEKNVIALQKEFNKLQKNRIDEDVARKAFLIYERSLNEKVKGEKR